MCSPVCPKIVMRPGMGHICTDGTSPVICPEVCIPEVRANAAELVRLRSAMSFIDNHAMAAMQSWTERVDVSGNLRRLALKEIRDATRGTLPDWAAEEMREKENTDG